MALCPQVHALEAGAAARVREAAQEAACAARGGQDADGAVGPAPLLRLRAAGCHASALSAAAPAPRPSPRTALLAALGLCMAAAAR